MSARFTRTAPSSLSWPAGMLALACAACGAVLALHCPPSAPMARFAFGLVVVPAWFHPHAWFVFLPTLLPTIGFAPWTGWITFEEVDMLLLAVAAGSSAQILLIMSQQASQARQTFAIPSGG